MSKFEGMEEKEDDEDYANESLNGKTKNISTTKQNKNKKSEHISNHPSKEKVSDLGLGDNKIENRKSSNYSDKDSCTIKKKKMQRLCHFSNRVKAFKEADYDEKCSFNSESSSCSFEKKCFINPKNNSNNLEKKNSSIVSIEKLQNFKSQNKEILKPILTKEKSFKSTELNSKINNLLRISLLENSDEAKSSPKYSKISNKSNEEIKDKQQYLELKENLNNGKKNNLKIKEENSYLKLKREKSKICNKKNDNDLLNNSLNQKSFNNNINNCFSYNNNVKQNDFLGIDDKSTTANTKSNYELSHRYDCALSSIDKSEINFFVENFSYNDIFNNLSQSMNLPNLIKNMDNEFSNECFSLSSLKDKDLGVYGGQTSNIFDFSASNNQSSNDALKCITLNSIKSENERRNTIHSIGFSNEDSNSKTTNKSNSNVK